MTDQVPDTCMFEGRKWAIEEVAGDWSVVPTNEDFGIETVASSSANWSGRVDHFFVCNCRLYLLKVEVNLAEGFQHVLPKGAQREVLTRYETMRFYDALGERKQVHEHRFEYFVFHDLPVPFTGQLFLRYPCIDFWDQPSAASDEDDDDGGQELCLRFENGTLVDSA